MAKFKHTHLGKSIALMLALILLAGSFTACGKKEEEITTTESTTQATTVPTTASPYLTGEYNPLTGELGYDTSLLKNRTVLVSVENSPQARPQWGIASADIVWEMVVEGGISRMLLMYADASRLPDKIGPTRSARHYFVELAEGFDSIFIHYGGSPQAYNAIKKQGTDDVDGMTYGDKLFPRDKTRNVSSEHRAYTTKENVIKGITDKAIRTEVEEGKEKPFRFSPTPATLPDGTCTAVKVPFSNDYTYNYTYDEATKLYMSALGDKPFMDDNGTQQSFTNIIICYVDVTPIPNDNKGRVTFDLSDGEGVFISNGTYQNITWEKGGYTDIMKFYVDDGTATEEETEKTTAEKTTAESTTETTSATTTNKTEIALNVGRTYIALVPSKNQSKTEIK